MKKDSQKTIERLSFFQGVAYGLPCAMMITLFSPMGVLQGVYVKFYGIDLTMIAGVILFARLFDAISDPLIGIFSDRYQQRKGTRKPFMVMGALLFIVAAYFLYIPFGSITPVYLSCWFILFYLGWTLFEIPHLAWGGEIVKSSAEKTRVYGFRAAFIYVGQLLFYCIPFFPFFVSQEITPETLRWSLYIAGALMLPSLCLCIYYVPNAAVDLNACKAFELDVHKPTKRFAMAIKSLIGNKPLVLFISAYFFTFLALGLWFGLIFIFVDIYLGLGESFAGMFLISFFVGLIASPACIYLARLIGRKTAWLMAMGVLFFAFVYTGLLMPTQTGLFELVMVKTLVTLGSVCMIIMADSTLSDIADYGQWRSRAKGSSAGSFFAIKGFIFKFAQGVGGALGLAISGWLGFDPQSPLNNSQGAAGLTFAVSTLPAILIALSCVFVALGPMTERRHGIVQRYLENRDARAKNAI